MAKKKPKVTKFIRDNTAALKAVMQEHLKVIGDGMVDQIISKLKNLPDAQRLNAIKDTQWKGQQAYKDALLSAMAVVAFGALKQVRKEVPKAAHVKLAEDEESWLMGEFDNLPPALRKKMKGQFDLLVRTQLEDLEKTIQFQFLNSVDSTDSLDTVADDLYGVSDDFLSSARVVAGSASTTAQVVAETRTSFFDDEEVAAQIDAFEFVNGDPVSEICQDLAGTVFSKDDPDRFRYTPPLHFNCKSYIVPILAGSLGDREIEKLQPSSKRIADTIQFAEKVSCGCPRMHFDEPSQ